MPVNDHELYDQWDEAMTNMKEAQEHYSNALRTGAPGLGLAKKDYEDAQQKFNEVADRIK